MAITGHCKNCGVAIYKQANRHKKDLCSNKCSGEYRHKIKPIKWVDQTCGHCGIVFKADNSQIKAGYGKYCSNACKYAHQRGANAPTYKGGWVRPDGYRQVSKDSRQWLEHDLVYFLKTGIKPNHQSYVYHVDGNKLNNDISNLILTDVHTRGEKHPGYGMHRSDETREKIRQSKLRDKNPAWKGGIAHSGAGYEYVRIGNYYLMTHRLVVAKAMGRKLRPGEIVHHINKNHTDNRPENLALCTDQSAHQWCHREEAKVFLA